MSVQLLFLLQVAKPLDVKTKFLYSGVYVPYSHYQYLSLQTLLDEFFCIIQFS